jgi:hypothetical protein
LEEQRFDHIPVVIIDDPYTLDGARGMGRTKKCATWRLEELQKAVASRLG